MKLLIISKSYYIFIYGLLMFGNIVLEMILTRDIMFLFESGDKEDILELHFRFKVLYTKFLTIVEVAYFARLFFYKEINSILQIRTIKFISMTLWIILGYRFGFSPAFVCYFLLAAISLIFIGRASNLEYSLIYKQYNHKVSADPDALRTHIILQIAFAIQNATKIFLSLQILTDLKETRGLGYFIYSCIKLPIICFEDRNQNRFSITRENLLNSTYFTALFNICGVYYISHVILNNEILSQLTTCLMEFLYVIKLILQIYLLYINKES